MLLFVSLIFVVYGISIDSPELIAVASVVHFLLFPVIEYQKEGIRSITPVSLFSLIKGIAAIANLTALLTADDPEWRSLFFLYTAEEHITFAMILHYAGGVFVILGFQKAVSGKAKLPGLFYSLTKEQLSFWLPLLIITFFLLNFLKVIPNLGTINGLVSILPVASIFFFTRYGAHHMDDRYIRFGFVLFVLTSIYAILFVYLRMLMIMPSVAFILGMIFGKKSFSAFRSPYLYPVYIGFFVFISYFALLGTQRSKVGMGYERLGQLQTAANEIENTEAELNDESSFLARFSSMNQLSQIKRVVEEDGFYNGETLSYFIFGFIPRFLWADKPRIEQGAWFAFRIGQGRMVDGRYKNSVDMTPPGEIYLNFGWLGVIVGCILHGYFFGMLWLTTNFWKSENNILGALFGFYLLFLGLFSFGADLQVVITTIAMYLLFWIINKITGNKEMSIKEAQTS